MHQNIVGHRWVRRYAFVLMCCTFLLVIAGALVTSNDAAGAIPDWPLSWGRIVPVLEGGVRYEFAHRALALLVTILTAILAWRTRTRLAWIALATILAQAALGGVLVKFLDPKAAAIAHAALAQAFFGLTVMLWTNRSLARQRRVTVAARSPVLAALTLFLQSILGAAVRHDIVGPIPHLAGAVIAIGMVMWAAIPRLAFRLLGVTFSQVFLGMGAWMARVANIDAPQPMPLMVFFTVAHVAVGALALGTAIELVMAAPASLPTAREGMAVA